MHETTKSLPKALSLLSSKRPRNVNWFQAGALLFGDWGTSRLYVLGLAFLVAGRTSFWLIAGMSAADPRGRVGVHADLPHLPRRGRRLHGRQAA